MKIPAALTSFYQQNYPDIYARRTKDIEHAGQAVLAIYNRNVFPDLKVTWGTYPNNLGHTDFPGASAAMTARTPQRTERRLRRTAVPAMRRWPWKKATPEF